MKKIAKNLLPFTAKARISSNEGTLKTLQINIKCSFFFALYRIKRIGTNAG